MPSRPGEFHPEPLTEPDVILSHHPARVTARRLPPFAERSGSSRFDPVGPSSTAMTCPLCSTGIIPIRRRLDSPGDSQISRSMIEDGNRGGCHGRAIAVRTDYTAEEVRGLAKRVKDAA